MADSPHSWDEAPLSTLCERIALTNPESEPEKPFLYVDVSSVSNETFRIVEPREVLGKDAPSRARKLIRSNDVIFATVRPSLRRVALVPPTLDGQVCSTGFCVLRSKQAVLEPTFLYFYLLTETIHQKVQSLQDGATYPAIRDSDLLDQNIRLPSIPEQRAVARALETVQNANEARQREFSLARECKAALLDSLFTHGAHSEPLKQEQMGDVPASWRVVDLGSLIAGGPQNGIYKPMDSYGDGTPIIRIDDFDNYGRVVSSDFRKVRLSSEEVALYELAEHDILLNRVNSLSHLGKTLLVPRSSESTVFESNMMRFRIDESRVLAKYVALYLLTEKTKNYMRGRAKRAVAQSSINQGDVRSIPVPIPSPTEQEEIVNILEAADSKLEGLEREMVSLNELFRGMLEELMTGQLSALPLIGEGFLV
jgi:type I restriction enzyme S subunit